MSSESISAILLKSLDFIQNDEETQPKSEEPSAASILLAEKKKSREDSNSKQLTEFIPLSHLSESSKAANPFFDQIADSSVQAPTYWKGIGSQKAKKSQNLEPVVTNAKKAERLKGESYKDKRTYKHASTASRKDRMHRLKNLY
jgi:hypothetical protein